MGPSNGGSSHDSADKNNVAVIKKLDYLAKYADPQHDHHDSDDTRRRRKKDRSSKTKHGSRKKKKEGKLGVQVHDADIDDDILYNQRRGRVKGDTVNNDYDDVENDGDDEDPPVVVPIDSMEPAIATSSSQKRSTISTFVLVDDLPNSAVVLGSQPASSSAAVEPLMTSPAKDHNISDNPIRTGKRRRRYDSDSETESDNEKFQRPDSGTYRGDRQNQSEDKDGPRRRLRRQRHDSNTEDEMNDNKANQSHRGRRQRHDSDTDDEEMDPTKHQPSHRRRHDSASEEEVDDKKNTNPPEHRPGRHDSDTDDKAPNETKHQRQRHDSDTDDEGSNVAQSWRRRQRHDSETEDDVDERKRHPPSRIKSLDVDNSSKSTQPRHRHDSEDSTSVDDRNKHTTLTSKSDKTSRTMASGHVAGIQSGQAFARTEARVQQKKHHDAQRMVDQHGVGETVYRDRSSGQKKMKHEPNGSADTAKVNAELQQRLLNTGRAQLQRQEEHRREMAALQESSFARYEDDVALEAMRKQAIHADDPMAAYAMKKKHSTSGVSAEENGLVAQQRPTYKGPPAKPNRFGILPGHRWDARDRGNGFEDRLLAQRYSAQHQQEKAYRYSSADM